MELGYGDQDLIYEEEARRLAESAPVPRPMCLACSKHIAEAPMLQCPQAHPLTKCTQCVESNKPCHIIPPQFRGDLERIQALARESHVRPSKRNSQQLQESVQKYVSKIEVYELKEPILGGYRPYEVPRPIPPPVPIYSPVRAATPMNSPTSTEDNLVTKTRGFQEISQMLNKIAELLSQGINLTPERDDVSKDSEATWLHANQCTMNGKHINGADKEER